MIGYSILYDELVEQDGGCQFYEEPEDKSLISLEMKALSLQKVQLDLPKTSSQKFLYRIIVFHPTYRED